MPFQQPLSATGWSSTLGPLAQREAIQGALSAGPCAFELPFGELIQVDQGLVAPFPVHLIGHGSDITNVGAAPSQIVSVAPNVDLLTVLASNSILENFNLGIGTLGGRGVVLGDGTSAHVPFGTSIRNIGTSGNFNYGIAVQGSQEEIIEDCWLNAQIASIHVNDTVSSDQGDRRVRGGELNAFGATGQCVLFESGGGLIFEGGTKFLDAYCHFKTTWKTAGSGGLILQGCSLENCSGPISVDMDGNVPFTRAVIANNSFGNTSVAVAVRNFEATPWLTNLSVMGNVVDVRSGAFGSVPGFDFGSVAQLSCAGNNVNGFGQAYAGIVIRNPCSGSVGINTIRNTTGAAIQKPDGNTTTNVSPFQG